VVALVWANSSWSAGYRQRWATELTIDLGGHAIAGIALGLLTPARAFLPEVDANRIADELSADLAVTAAEVRDILPVQESIPVIERLQDLLHSWTSYLVVPLFALANAGATVPDCAIGRPETPRA
jgi:Na+/H+ antiporter NhaA